MLTTEEIKALCEAAGLELDTSLGNLWLAVICKPKTNVRNHKVSIAEGWGKTEDEALHNAWEAYVNNRRD